MTDLPATACAEAPIDKFLLGIGILKFFTTGGQVFGIASACLGWGVGTVKKRACALFKEDYGDVYNKWVNITFPEECISNSVSYDDEPNVSNYDYCVKRTYLYKYPPFSASYEDRFDFGQYIWVNGTCPAKCTFFLAPYFRI